MLFSADWARLTLMAESLLLFLQVRSKSTAYLQGSRVSISMQYLLIPSFKKKKSIESYNQSLKGSVPQLKGRVQLETLGIWVFHKICQNEIPLM